MYGISAASQNKICANFELSLNWFGSASRDGAQVRLGCFVSGYWRCFILYSSLVGSLGFYIEHCMRRMVRISTGAY